MIKVVSKILPKKQLLRHSQTEGGLDMYCRDRFQRERLGMAFPKLWERLGTAFKPALGERYKKHQNSPI